MKGTKRLRLVIQPRESLCMGIEPVVVECVVKREDVERLKKIAVIAGGGLPISLEVKA